MADNTAEKLTEKQIEVFTLPEEIRDPLVLAELVDKEAAHYLFQSFFPHLPLDMIKDIDCGPINVRVDNWAHGYARLLDENVDHMSPEWRVHFAQIVMRCGDEEGAVKLVEQAYEEDPELVDGFARLGGLYRLHAYWAGAYNLMEKDVVAQRITPEWKLRYAEVVAEFRDFGQAERIVAEAYAENPEVQDGYARLGWCHVRRNDWHSAYRYMLLDAADDRLSPHWKIHFADAVVTNFGDLDRSFKLIDEAYQEDLTLRDGYSRIAWKYKLMLDYPEDYNFDGYESINWHLTTASLPLPDTIKHITKDMELGRLTPGKKTLLARLYALQNDMETARNLIVSAEAEKPGVANAYARISSGIVINDERIKTFIKTFRQNTRETSDCLKSEPEIVNELVHSITPKNSKPNVILFGASGAGRSAFHKLNGWYNIVGFCDNDPKKQGKTILGQPVFPPEALIDLTYDKIIVCSMFEDEIIMQLIENLKISEEKIERADLPLTAGLLRRLADVSGKEKFDLEHVKSMAETIFATCNTYNSLKKCDDAISTIANYIARLPNIRKKTRSLTKNDNPVRIVICVQRIKAGHQDSHVLHFFAIAAELVKHAHAEVHIVSTHENQMHAKEVGFIPCQTQLNKYFSQKVSRNIIDEKHLKHIYLHYFDNIGLNGTIESSKKILDINPDVIIYPSGRNFGNESTVIRRILHNFLPTVFIFTNYVDLVDKYNDLIISSGNHNINSRYKDLPVIAQLYPGLESNWKKLTYNQPLNNNPIIISAIAGNRMSQAFQNMPEESIRSLMCILDKVPSSTWYLVGASNKKNLMDSHPLIRHYAQKDRIRIFPRLLPNEFESLVSKSQLYISPPHFYGGGASSIIACKNGVPILCFKDSDVASRQPPHLVFDNSQIDKFTELAIDLLQDDHKHQEVAREQHEWVTRLGRSKTVKFYNLLCLAARTAKNRLVNFN